MPVYNSSKYLARCLDSIRNQSYRNLEIILVDDGSEDSSPEICNLYCKMDARFICYHIHNNGVANARNYALDRCSGEYVVFIDSDDFVELRYVERLLNVAIMSGCKLVTCSANWIDEDKVDEFINNKALSDNYLANTKDFKIIDIEQYSFIGKYGHIYCWAAIYHRTIIEKFILNKNLS